MPRMPCADDVKLASDSASEEPFDAMDETEFLRRLANDSGTENRRLSPLTEPGRLFRLEWLPSLGDAWKPSTTLESGEPPSHAHRAGNGIVPSGATALCDIAPKLGRRRDIISFTDIW